MGAWSAGSKSSAKDAALFAALLPEQSSIARGALVDDGRRRQTASKAELELVGRSPTLTKAALAAGIGAVGFAASRRELTAARDAHALLVRRRAIVTQRSFPRVVVGVGASTRR